MIVPCNPAEFEPFIQWLRSSPADGPLEHVVLAQMYVGEFVVGKYAGGPAGNYFGGLNYVPVIPFQTPPGSGVQMRLASYFWGTLLPDRGSPVIVFFDMFDPIEIQLWSRFSGGLADITCNPTPDFLEIEAHDDTSSYTFILTPQRTFRTVVRPAGVLAALPGG
jgi:hypothetical protein